MEDIYFTLIVDAHEERNVATFDVPGSFLNADMPKDKRILMKLRGYFVDIMCQVNPYYEQHVRYENGENVLYILVLRAIYGCIKSELLWYNLFSTTLYGFGFEINTYHKCVANKVVEVT